MHHVVDLAVGNGAEQLALGSSFRSPGMLSIKALDSFLPPKGKAQRVN
jgi:hypothetical protein